MVKNPLVIALLPFPQHLGDLHDKPFKYIVSAPGWHDQKFWTKKESQRWRSIYFRVKDFATAIRTFVNS